MRLRGQSVLRERFNFLGYSFGPYCYKGNGQWYLTLLWQI
jgi:hypothetical protein